MRDERERRDHQPGNPWAPPWPTELERQAARKGLPQLRETLSRARHPTARGRRPREDDEQDRALSA